MSMSLKKVNIRRDSYTGELVCNDCGLIFEERFVNGQHVRGWWKCPHECNTTCRQKRIARDKYNGLTCNRCGETFVQKRVNGLLSFTDGWWKCPNGCNADTE